MKTATHGRIVFPLQFWKKVGQKVNVKKEMEYWNSNHFDRLPSAFADAVYIASRINGIAPTLQSLSEVLQVSYVGFITDELVTKARAACSKELKSFLQACKLPRVAKFIGVPYDTQRVQKCS